MKVYEAIKKIEEENATSLRMVVLENEESKIIKAYDQKDIACLKDVSCEVANYDCVRIAKVSDAGALIMVNDQMAKAVGFCERRIDELEEKGRWNWTEQDAEDYEVCKGNIESEEAERRYLDGERW